MTDITVVSKTKSDGQSYAGYDATSQNIVFAFRGSSNILNWYNNLRFEQTAYSACNGCLVHTGFLVTYNDLKGSMLDAYQKLTLKYKGKPVVVTGHSLGGAVAELFAADLQRTYGKVDFLYTYGTPRVGNQAFAQYVHSILPDAVRVTHYKDPVPHVPPQQILGQSYLQIPTEVFYFTEAGDGNNYKICTMPGVQEDPNCSDSFKLPSNINDHLYYLGKYTGCNTSSDIPESQTEDIQDEETTEQEVSYLRKMLTRKFTNKHGEEQQTKQEESVQDIPDVANTQQIE